MSAARIAAAANSLWTLKTPPACALPDVTVTIQNGGWNIAIEQCHGMQQHSIDLPVENLDLFVDTLRQIQAMREGAT